MAGPAPSVTFQVRLSLDLGVFHSFPYIHPDILAHIYSDWSGVTLFPDRGRVDPCLS